MSVVGELFRMTKEEDKKTAVEKLISYSFPSYDFYLMVVLSVAMATLGLLLDNASVVIGSMLIAPVLYPVLSTSMGVVMNDSTVLRKSVTTLAKSLMLALATAFVITLFFSNGEQVLASIEIMSRTSTTILHAGVAVVAGFAASFALVKPKLSEILPGIAISVALVPPLAVTGIGLAVFKINIITGSFVLFLVNSLGIIFTSMLVFSLMNLYTKRGAAVRAIEKEEKEAEAHRHPENSISGDDIPPVDQI